MDIQIEFQSGIPLYEQIAHQILELIEKKELLPGDQLPTTRQLAVQLGVNFNTIARAYRMLDRGAVISTQPGRGTFILDPEEQKPRTRAGEDKIVELTRFYIRKAAYLGYEADEIKGYFERISEESKQD